MQDGNYIYVATLELVTIGRTVQTWGDDVNPETIVDEYGDQVYYPEDQVQPAPDS